MKSHLYVPTLRSEAPAAKTRPTSPIRRLRARLYPVKRRLLRVKPDLLKALERFKTRPRRQADQRKDIEWRRERLEESSRSKGQRQFMGLFRELCDLKPHESVLDIGCGLGTFAVALTQYLNKSGRYEGIDVGADRIKKCRHKITRAFPNFRFQAADLYNESYNPTGHFKASEYRFPYEDASFDFVFARSLFTHMLPDDVANYVLEIARVLKPNGRCLVTFFLINDKTSRMQDQKFPFDFGIYRVRRTDVPELAVSYQEPHVRALFAEHGLRIVEPIRLGTWSGAEGAVKKSARLAHHQDVIVAVKG